KHLRIGDPEYALRKSIAEPRRPEIDIDEDRGRTLNPRSPQIGGSQERSARLGIRVKLRRCPQDYLQAAGALQTGRSYRAKLPSEVAAGDRHRFRRSRIAAAGCAIGLIHHAA